VQDKGLGMSKIAQKSFENSIESYNITKGQLGLPMLRIVEDHNGQVYREAKGGKGDLYNKITY
jgi:hypothetical protein